MNKLSVLLLSVLITLSSCITTPGINYGYRIQHQHQQKVTHKRADNLTGKQRRDLRKRHQRYINRLNYNNK